MHKIYKLIEANLEMVRNIFKIVSLNTGKYEEE